MQNNQQGRPAVVASRRSRDGLTLVIQIPCFNESATLPIALADLPRDVAGFSRVKILVIDDGSSDDTALVARRCGVDRVVSLGCNRGLARAFMIGLETALAMGADVIVNTDADNQYDAAAIPALTAPVVAGKADIVVGARPIEGIAHFSPLKKRLQRLGSLVMRLASGTPVIDAPSGFRAISREAACRMAVTGRYTYTMETLIQAGSDGLVVASVPVGVNPEIRPSRLMKSMTSYIRRSALTILRVWLARRASHLLWPLAGLAGFIAFATLFIGGAYGHWLVCATVLATGGALGEALAYNRKLIEELRTTSRADRADLAQLTDRLSLHRDALGKGCSAGGFKEAAE